MASSHPPGSCRCASLSNLQSLLQAPVHLSNIKVNDASAKDVKHGLSFYGASSIPWSYIQAAGIALNVAEALAISQDEVCGVFMIGLRMHRPMAFWTASMQSMWTASCASPCASRNEPQHFSAPLPQPARQSKRTWEKRVMNCNVRRCTSRLYRNGYSRLCFCMMEDFSSM